MSTTIQVLKIMPNYGNTEYQVYKQERRIQFYEEGQRTSETTSNEFIGSYRFKWMAVRKAMRLYKSLHSRCEVVLRLSDVKTN
jgi:hypothetical protein